MLPRSITRPVKLVTLLLISSLVHAASLTLVGPKGFLSNEGNIAYPTTLRLILQPGDTLRVDSVYTFDHSLNGLEFLSVTLPNNFDAEGLTATHFSVKPTQRLTEGTFNFGASLRIDNATEGTTSAVAFSGPEYSGISSNNDFAIGGLGINFSNSQIILTAGQQTFVDNDQFSLMLIDENDAGLFWAGRQFLLELNDPDGGLEWQALNQEGYTLTQEGGGARINLQTASSEGNFSISEINISPQGQNNLNASWVISSGDWSTNAIAVVAIGTPVLTITQNKIFVAGRSKEKISVRIDAGVEHPGLQAGDEIQLRLPEGLGLWSSSSGERIINLTMGSSSLLSLELDIFDLSDSWVADSFRIELFANGDVGTRQISTNPLWIGPVSIDISEVRFILGQTQAPFMLTLTDVNQVGIFSENDNSFYLEAPGEFTFGGAAAGVIIDQSDQRILYNPPISQNFSININGLNCGTESTLASTHLNYGTYTESTQDSPSATLGFFTCGDLSLNIGSGSDLSFITNNPQPSTIQLIMDQLNGIQNLRVGDSIYFTIPNNMELAWTGVGSSLPLGFGDPQIINNKQLLFPVIGEIDAYHHEFECEVLPGDASTTSAQPILMRIRGTTNHDSTAAEFQVGTISFQFDGLRMWSKQTGWEYLNFWLHGENLNLSEVQPLYFSLNESPIALDYFEATELGEGVVIDTFSIDGRSYLQFANITDDSAFPVSGQIRFASEVVLSSQLAIYAFDPRLYPESDPTQISTETLQVGDPAFTNIDTSYHLVINGTPSSLSQSWTIVEDPNAAAINAVDDINITLPAEFVGAIDNAYLEYSNNQMEGIISGTGIYFDIPSSPLPTVSDSLVMTIHFDNTIDMQNPETISISYDGLFFESGPLVHCDTINFSIIYQDGNNSNARFAAGSDAYHIFPELIFSDIDALSLQDSITLVFDGNVMEWQNGNGANLIQTYTGSGEMYFLDQPVRTLGNSILPSGTLSIFTSKTGNTAYPTGEIFQIGSPTVTWGTNGRKRFPKDTEDNSYNHSWILPDLNLQENASAMAWRPASELRLSIAALPLNFRRTTIPIVISEGFNPSARFEGDSVCIITLTDGDVPTELSIQGLEVEDFTSVLSKGEIKVSFDGYPDNTGVNNFGYSAETPAELKIGEVDLDFIYAGKGLDQYCLQNGVFDLDALQFLDQQSYDDAFEGNDLIVIEGLDDRITLTDTISDLSSGTINGLSVTSSFSLLRSDVGLYLEGKIIRKTNHQIIVTNPGVVTDSTQLRFGSHVWIASDDSINYASAIFPEIIIYQGAQPALDYPSNKTLHLQLPSEGFLTWPASFNNEMNTNWTINRINETVLELSATDTIPLDTIKIIDLPIIVGDSSSTTIDYLKLNTIPERRTGNELLFHVIDETADLAVSRPRWGISDTSGNTLNVVDFIVNDPEFQYQIHFSDDQQHPIFENPTQFQFFAGGMDTVMDYEPTRDTSWTRSYTPADSAIAVTRGWVEFNTPYQGTATAFSTLFHAITLPLVSSNDQLDLISATEPGQIHVLQDIVLQGDEYGLLGGSRDTLFIRLPSAIREFIKFPQYPRNIMSTDPNVVNPTSILINDYELRIPLSEPLDTNEVIVLSYLSVTPKTSLQDTVPNSFNLEFSFPHRTLNPQGITNMPDTLGTPPKIFGYLDFTTIYNDDSVGYIPLIKNSINFTSIGSITPYYEFGGELEIDNILYYLPTASGIYFIEEADRVYLHAGWGTWDNIPIGSIGPGENHYPERNEFPVTAVVYLSDGHTQITHNVVNLRVAEPTFRILDQTSFIYLPGDTIHIQEFVIADDPVPEFQILKSTPMLHLNWRNGDQIPHLEPINKENIIIIGATLDTDTWSITDIELDSIIIRGIDLIADSTFHGREYSPFVEVGSTAQIYLNESFAVVDPVINMLTEQSTMNFDSLNIFSGMSYTEDEHASLAIAADAQDLDLVLSISFQGYPFRWENGDTIRHIPINHLEPGDSMQFLKGVYLDPREVLNSGVMGNSIELELEIKVVLPNEERDLYLGSYSQSLSLPDIPFLPQGNGDAFLIPLYAGDDLGSEISLISNSGDTLVMNPDIQIINDSTIYAPGYGTRISIPRYASIDLPTNALNWVSDQFLQGSSLSIRGVIEDGFREVTPFEAVFNSYPFQSIGPSLNKYVHNNWPAGRAVGGIKLADDSPSFQAILHLSGVEHDLGEVDDLIYPTLDTSIVFDIGYLELSANDTDKPHLNLNIPVIIDSIAPSIIETWPLTGLEPGSDSLAHAISPGETFNQFIYENILLDTTHSDQLLIWKSPTDTPDTLVLDPGFSTRSWQRPTLLREFYLAGDSSILTNRDSYEIILDPESLADSLFWRIDDANIWTNDVLAEFLDSLTDQADQLTIVTMVSDLAGNQVHQDLSYRLIWPNDDPVDEQLFNYPNPFGSLNDESTNISYYLKVQADKVELVILDAAGSLVWRKSGNASIGRHDIIWNGKNLWGETCASGIYFGVLDVDDLPEVYVKILVKNYD